MASITIWQWELLQGCAHIMAGWLYEACAQYVSNIIMFKTKQNICKHMNWEPGWVGYLIERHVLQQLFVLQAARRRSWPLALNSFIYINLSV